MFVIPKIHGGAKRVCGAFIFAPRASLNGMEEFYATFLLIDHRLRLLGIPPIGSEDMKLDNYSGPVRCKNAHALSDETKREVALVGDNFTIEQRQWLPRARQRRS